MSGKFMMNGIEYLGGSSGGGGGNVDDVYVNGESVLDGNKIAQVTSYKEVTLAEYQALPSSKLSDGIMYCISDIGGANDFPPLIYSDEEREVGVWRDGKPLYQKTLTFIPSASGYYIDISSLNVSKMISCTGFVTQSNGNHVNIPYCTNQSDFAIAYFSSSTNRLCTVYAGSYNVSEWHITLQYTKTTDTAGSGTWTTQAGYAHHYSTTEHVIGTWIDGKTLYERSFTKTLANSPDADTSSFLVASNVTGIETLVKIEGTIKAASAYAFAPVCGLPVQVGWNYAFHINPTNQLVVWTSNTYANYSNIAGGTAICTLRYTKTTD